MLPQTYTARIAALDQRIALLRRLTVIAGLVAVGAFAAIWLFLPPGAGFAVGFPGRVIVPLRLITGGALTYFEPANRSLFTRGQGVVVMGLLNYAFLGLLIDPLRRAARLNPGQTRAARAALAVLGAFLSALPWIMIAGLTAWVERRRVMSGSLPGKRTWLTSLGTVCFGLFWIAPPFMAMLVSFSGGMDFSAQDQLKTMSPAVVAALPADQEDAIGSDQLHFVRAQAAWLGRQPEVMARELAQIGGAWHPPLLAEKTRLGFMAEMAGNRLSPRQHGVLAAMGADNASYAAVRSARIALAVLGVLSGAAALWLARIIARRSWALRRFGAMARPRPSRSRPRRHGGSDAAFA